MGQVEDRTPWTALVASRAHRDFDQTPARLSSRYRLVVLEHELRRPRSGCRGRDGHVARTPAAGSNLSATHAFRHVVSDRNGTEGESRPRLPRGRTGIADP